MGPQASAPCPNPRPWAQHPQLQPSLENPPLPSAQPSLVYLVPAEGFCLLPSGPASSLGGETGEKLWG